jgi:type II secretory pathway component GspD/PulD (secretin)
MGKSNREISRHEWLIGVLGVIIVLWIGGQQTLFAQADPEYEAEATLNNLKIDITADSNTPATKSLKRPTRIFEQIVGGTSEWKLTYFCRHYKAVELKRIVHEQFATALFDKKGKKTKMVDYTVSSVDHTNQLIVRCPSEEDALSVLAILDEVDVRPIQVKIDCMISEVYANMTFDRETTIAIDNLFGESVALKPGGTAFGDDVRTLVEDDEFLPAFPGASLREVARSRMGLNIGFLNQAKDGHAFAALVDLLESRGYLKILMNPTLEVVNGGEAKVLSKQLVPLDRITMRRTDSDFLETRTDYKDVIDSLEIKAHVFAGNQIGLDTTIVLGSKNTPEGVKQVPIITTKRITNKNSRIRQGESLIIGGMKKNEEYAVVRGVPILRDLPLIGFLFSSEDTEMRAVETIFILTPTISDYGRPRAEVMKEIQRKHKPPTP